jgi:hypothetical protein
MLREIATKIGSKCDGERRLPPPVYRRFIEELTRQNIKPGVSRQKLVARFDQFART